MKKKRILLLGAALLLLALLCCVYAVQYYHADGTAQAALKSDEVPAAQIESGWFFDGPGTENALVFYPGGKVEETAYAPLCQRLAEAGMDVFLVKMPLHLAVLGQNKADGILGEYPYAHWYIGGHSLGGAVAALYAAEHADRLDGVILLAAYSTKELEEDEKVVLVYGSEDTVLNREKYRENLKNLPQGSVEHVIEGGNHAQFGSYGSQKGDGEARIPPEAQWEETVSVIMDSIPADP